MRTLAVGAVLLLSACAQSGASEPALDGAETLDDALLNGKLVLDGSFPSAVFIQLQAKADPTFHNSCTATRVGPRLLLTAAHCMVAYGKVDRSPRLDLFVGAAFEPLSVKVSRYVPHPSYLACTVQECPVAGQGLAKVSDVALVETANDLPAQIATAVVDARPTRFGELLLNVGAGNDDEGMLGTRRYGVTYPVTISWLNLAGGPDRDALAQYYTESPGTEYGGKGLGTISNGDSGGPMFRKVDGDFVVVGVHAAGNETQHSYDTRVDANVPNGVHAWLLENGVKAISSRVPDSPACPVGQARDHALNRCVQANGVVPVVVLGPGARAKCEADRALPAAQQPRRMDLVATCTQRGFPVTLLHRWLTGA